MQHPEWPMYTAFQMYSATVAICEIPIKTADHLWRECDSQYFKIFRGRTCVSSGPVLIAPPKSWKSSMWWPILLIELYNELSSLMSEFIICSWEIYGRKIFLMCSLCTCTIRKFVMTANCMLFVCWIISGLSPAPSGNAPSRMVVYHNNSYRIVCWRGRCGGQALGLFTNK